MKSTKQLETYHPEIAEGFKKIQKQQYELFAQKMLTYGKDNISMGTKLDDPQSIKLSLTAIWIRMNDKVNRLKNLIIFNNKNFLDKEPTIDSWKDITNYAIIAQLVTLGIWRKDG
jgi:hypothetical protein